MEGIYLAVDEITKKRIEHCESDKVTDLIESLCDSGDYCFYEIDNMWDALHFFLTKTSAITPVEDSLLSKSIIGTTPMEHEDYIAYSTTEDCEQILSALKALDEEQLKKGFKLKEFKANEIYPNYWENDEAEELFDELMMILEQVKKIYQKAVEEKKTIIATIY